MNYPDVFNRYLTILNYFIRISDLSTDKADEIRKSIIKK
jgi:hypothetical protein